MTGLTAAALCFVPVNRASAQNSSPASVNTASTPALPYGVSEVVKMYQGGISKDVIINYVENSGQPFHLSADGIIYMHHLGMPVEITQAMMQRDTQLQREQPMAAQPMAQPYPGAAPAPGPS